MRPKATQRERQASEAFRNYRDSIPALLDDYRRAAEKYRTRHNWFQIAVIVGSILTSVATTASAEQGVWSWLAVGLSSIVSISAGIISYFKFRERSINLQQTADSIDQEVQAFSLGIRRYKNLSLDQAAAEFAEEIERIKEEQRKKELQLEQPPEVQQNQAQGRGATVQP
jgi:Na+/melibiose symporter-like transporter